MNVSHERGLGHTPGPLSITAQPHTIDFTEVGIINVFNHKCLTQLRCGKGRLLQKMFLLGKPHFLDVIVTNYTPSHLTSGAFSHAGRDDSLTSLTL